MNTDWNTLYCNDVNTSFNNFLDRINNLLDTYMPLKKLSKKEFKQQYKPWITNGILKSIERKNKIYKRYTKTKNNEARTQIYSEYKILRNTLTNLINLSKENYYKSFFRNHNNNIKHLWKGIKEIVNINSKNLKHPTSIQINDSVSNDPVIICNEFNNYFSNIADKIINNRKYGGRKHFSQFLNDPSPNSFMFKPCEPIEIFDTISQLETSKATGPNSIPTEIFKLIKNEVSLPLSKIINDSFSSGIHPEKLKIVNVIPVFKKGSRLQVSNYRPISLLSNINKIFEKVMHRRMTEFLEFHKKIYIRQFGFRSKHSTTHALIDITNKIKEALDKNLVSCGVFVDLQKAFDTVNHEILLNKLHHYGFRGCINDWFRSYLNERKQRVTINGFESEIKLIKHGVPQGSVLGPLLFLIYINDLNKSISFSSTYHFADDTNIININTNYKKLQKEINHDLKSLNEWLLANKISLNVAKTELIFFHKVRSPLPPNLKIKMNGKRLTHSNYVKYLGIYIDETLTGTFHCEEIIKRLNRANGILAKARHYMPLHILKNIYYAVFSSHLLYGSQIWGQTSKTVMNKISLLQRKAVRIITHSKTRDHTNPLFKELKILKVMDNISLNNCLLVHDYFNAKLPQSFNAFFTKATDLHSIGTRSSNLGFLNIKRYNSTKYGLKQINKICASDWNSLTRKMNNERKCINDDAPVNLHDLPRSTLKRKITEFFLNSYL